MKNFEYNSWSIINILNKIAIPAQVTVQIIYHQFQMRYWAWRIDCYIQLLILHLDWAIGHRAAVAIVGMSCHKDNSSTELKEDGANLHYSRNQESDLQCH
jgi:hypothetical protein